MSLLNVVALHPAIELHGQSVYWVWGLYLIQEDASSRREQHYILSQGVIRKDPRECDGQM